MSAASAGWRRRPDRDPVVVPSGHRDHRGGGPPGSFGGEAGNLRLRIASAAVLAPVALVGAYVGGWIFVALCVLAAGIILFEWTMLVVRRADRRVLLPGYAALLVGAVLAGLGIAGPAVGAIAAGAVLAALALTAWPQDFPASNPILWAAGGVLYAGAVLVGPVVLRGDPQWGLTALLFLFATVWTTDIFAFFAGHTLDGPLLWPQVSPNKTWAGAIGGLVGGVAAGFAVAYASGVGNGIMAGIMALVLSVLAQAGDLFESAVKRRFHSKDAGQLIPGHGGLMDRLDGFLVAAFTALLIGLARQGTDAPALGLLLW